MPRWPTTSVCQSFWYHYTPLSNGGQTSKSKYLAWHQNQRKGMHVHNYLYSLQHWRTFCKLSRYAWCQSATCTMSITTLYAWWTQIIEVITYKDHFEERCLSLAQALTYSSMHKKQETHYCPRISKHSYHHRIYQQHPTKQVDDHLWQVHSWKAKQSLFNAILYKLRITQYSCSIVFCEYLSTFSFCKKESKVASWSKSQARNVNLLLQWDMI